MCLASFRSEYHSVVITRYKTSGRCFTRWQDETCEFAFRSFWAKISGRFPMEVLLFLMENFILDVKLFQWTQSMKGVEAVRESDRWKPRQPLEKLLTRCVNVAIERFAMTTVQSIRSSRASEKKRNSNYFKPFKYKKWIWIERAVCRLQNAWLPAEHGVAFMCGPSGELSGRLHWPNAGDRCV